MLFMIEPIALSKIIYDLRTCSIIIQSEVGETRRISCEDLQELHYLAVLTNSALDELKSRGGVSVHWELGVSANRHPIQAENE